MRTRSSSKRHKAASSNDDLDEQKELVLPELGKVIELEDNSFARSLYHDLASDSAIDTFLKKSRFFCLTERRWKLPRSYTKLIDTNFYMPFCNVISSIVKHFWRDASVQKARQVVDTHNTDLRHSKDDPPSHKSRPSLVVRAEGPSFQHPTATLGAKPSKISFSNVAGCIEIQVDGDELPVSEQLVRVAIYARQLFIHQPNRRFVRVLFLTGQHLRLFHFDRSGAQYTPSIDINEDPNAFVRLVLGLSSPNESDIGLDPSIQWRIENGRKVGGALTTRGTNNAEIVYPLLNVVPFFRRNNIRGRCTTCWRVSDPVTGEELLVKDSWRASHSISEYAYLQEALGIPGVVQMVSHEPDRGQTKELRGFGNVYPGDFENRVETRLVMKCYGDPIVGFTSAKQLLCALRDAIAGHKRLFKKGILHRDVSIQNVVLGKPEAEPGDRGVLIDLDMATRRGEDGFLPTTDWRIGIPLYQSIMVLSSKSISQPLSHDHLDDLESFLYVLTHILYSYDCHGTLHEVDDLLTRWDKYLGTFAADLKESFLARQFLPRHISMRWPAPSLDVFLGFKDIILPMVDQKVAITLAQPEDGPEILKALMLNAEHHYDEVIRLFDTGIAALEKDDDEEASSCLQSHPTSHQPFSRPPAEQSSSKRRSDEDPDSQPLAKRSKSNTPSSCSSSDTDSSSSDSS
ncbi:hypothetical protein EST38_g10415 [Candolleomyces aberdarensis]|uniref:Fungal-type protein kinase domain-containing protein n=1 Tax=Candolleomyces aberdarensis TaxID=2316362 RepID=A0A4Q2D7F3_9AGAR|nr:hypothetical protein EST38_g10415 [Candolleomyces aberdarensis]